MITLPARALLALSLTTTLAVAGAGPAAAHENRTAGPLRFVVGWGDEPAYTGFKNSVQVTISETNGAPVTDVTDTLKVEVIKGQEKITSPLVPNFRVGAFGTPGDYRAWLTPTRPGAYTFHISGTIRGQNVDESFSSSRTTFNDVEDVSSIQFPAKDPSTGQLAMRVDREFPRLDSAVQQAEDEASTARTIAIAGLGVGVLGLLAGAGALVVARRGGRATNGGRTTAEKTVPTGSLSR
jgi:hypothetical protein